MPRVAVAHKTSIVPFLLIILLLLVLQNEFCVKAEKERGFDWENGEEKVRQSLIYWTAADYNY